MERGKRMKRVVSAGLFLLLSLFFLSSGAGQERVDPNKTSPREGTRPFGFTTSRSPIDITSDSVEGDQKKNLIVFKGNVVAKQEEATLYAHQLTLYYDPETRRLKEIVATGNVRVTQGDRRATSQKATFFQNENKIVLEGEVVIREGENVIRGEKVVYLIDEERSFVEGGKGGRVSTTIVPPPKEEKKK